MIGLTLHPLFQITGISLALYAAYLGWQRSRSLHFGATAQFDRSRHAVIGATAIIILLAGMSFGLIMVARSHHGAPLESLHGKGAMVLLPFLLIGLFSGFYLYLYPEKRKVLPAIHAINNAVVLLLAVFQIVSGLRLLLAHLAKGG